MKNETQILLVIIFAIFSLSGCSNEDERAAKNSLELEEKTAIEAKKLFENPKLVSVDVSFSALKKLVASAAVDRLLLKAPLADEVLTVDGMGEKAKNDLTSQPNSTMSSASDVISQGRQISYGELCGSLRQESAEFIRDCLGKEISGTAVVRNVRDKLYSVFSENIEFEVKMRSNELVSNIFPNDRIKIRGVVGESNTQGSFQLNDVTIDVMKREIPANEKQLWDVLRLAYICNPNFGAQDINRISQSTFMGSASIDPSDSSTGTVTIYDNFRKVDDTYLPFLRRCAIVKNKVVVTQSSAGKIDNSTGLIVKSSLQWEDRARSLARLAEADSKKFAKEKAERMKNLSENSSPNSFPRTLCEPLGVHQDLPLSYSEQPEQRHRVQKAFKNIR